MLHFHTCGAYPPGEISWMVIDPTIEVDGKLIWQAGHLTPAPCRRIGKVFDRWTEFDALFSGQLGDIGLGKVNWRIAWKKG